MKKIKVIIQNNSKEVLADNMSVIDYRKSFVENMRDDYNSMSEAREDALNSFGFAFLTEKEIEESWIDSRV